MLFFSKNKHILKCAVFVVLYESIWCRLKCQ